MLPGAMHEVLNETNKDEVLADVEAFLDGSEHRMSVRLRTFAPSD